MKFQLSFTDEEYKKLMNGEPAMASRIPSEKRMTVEFDAQELYFMDKDKASSNDCRVRLRQKPMLRYTHVMHAKKTPKK